MYVLINKMFTAFTLPYDNQPTGNFKCLYTFERLSIVFTLGTHSHFYSTKYKYSYAKRSVEPFIINLTDG